MKCVLFVLTFLFTFLNHLPNITALALTIKIADESALTVPALVVWTREFNDEAAFTFDLRFIEQRKQQIENGFVDFDVGLARANIVMNPTDNVGTTSVVFPGAGQFVLEAVSGSDNRVIGRSNSVVSVNLTATASPTPTSMSSTAKTSSTSSSSTEGTSATSQPVAAIHKTGPNIPAIIGGVVAAILALAALIVLSIFLNRRRQAMKRRLTFHRDMMVQRRLSRLPPASAPAMIQVIREGHEPALLAATKRSSGEDSQGSMPSSALSSPVPSSISPPPSLPPIRHSGSTLSSDIDLERGLAHIDIDSAIPRPQVTGLVVPPPRGPRLNPHSNSLRRPPGIPVSAPPTSHEHEAPQHPDSPPPTPTLTRTDVQGLTTTIITSRSPNKPTPLRTQRQKKILDRISMLRTQMEEFEGKRDSPSQNRLQDMTREMMWLRDQENGSWAMGLTDVLPPGHTRYMTP